MILTKQQPPGPALPVWASSLGAALDPRPSVAAQHPCRHSNPLFAARALMRSVATLQAGRERDQLDQAGLA